MHDIALLLFSCMFLQAPINKLSRLLKKMDSPRFPTTIHDSADSAEVSKLFEIFTCIDPGFGHSCTHLTLNLTHSAHPPTPPHSTSRTRPPTRSLTHLFTHFFCNQLVLQRRMCARTCGVPIHISESLRRSIFASDDTNSNTGSVMTPRADSTNQYAHLAWCGI